MKRYRIISFDFDSRADMLEKAPESASPEYFEMHESNRKSVIDDLVKQYGVNNSDIKVTNFKALGNLQCSFYAFHNKFIREVRNAYIIGSYYPALVGACALGERLLNHLILLLRDEYRLTPEYKRIYKKQSFDNWDIVLETLDAWNILQNDVKEQFLDLKKLRNRSIHFNYDTEKNAIKDALQGVKLIEKIVSKQFSFSALKDWIFVHKGEIYIKGDSIDIPYIRLIVLPISGRVGANHTVDFAGCKIVVSDPTAYEDRVITDQEFIDLREKHFSDKRDSSKAAK